MAEDHRAYIALCTFCVVLCQKQSEEELVCPLSNPIPQRDDAAYKEFISLAYQFQNVDATPYPDLEHLDEESVRDNLAS